MTSVSSIAFITGGNTGLGYEIVKALLRSDKERYTILLGGRSLDKAQAAVSSLQTDVPDSTSTVQAVQIDIGDDDSIARAVEVVREQYGRVDVLINNAGAQFDQRIRDGTMSARQAWNSSWDTNVTGTHLLTQALAPLLITPGPASTTSTSATAAATTAGGESGEGYAPRKRLLFIASGTSTLAEHSNPAIPINRAPPAGWPKLAASWGLPAYRSAKAGLNMLMLEWDRLLRGDGVGVWCVSPGMLATGLGGDREANERAGAIEPGIGAGLVREVVEGGWDAHAGKVVRKAGVQPW